MVRCPVCKSEQTSIWSIAKDYEYFTSTAEYTYYHCTHCDTIYIDPVPADQLKYIYPPNYYSFVTAKKNIVSRIKEWMDKRFFTKILKDIHGLELKVLDVGGGTGWLASIVKNIDPRITTTQIVDIDEKAGAIAEKAGHQYFKGTLEEFQTTEKYDLILMLNLIEHVSDPFSVLTKAESLLSDNGVILIKTPNTVSLDSRIFKKSYWGGLHCPRHWVIFSEKSFRMLADRTNLVIKKLSYTQGSPFWAFSIIIFLYRKGLVKVSAQRPVIFHPLFPLIGGITAAFDYGRSYFSKTSQMFIILRSSDKNKV